MKTNIEPRPGGPRPGPGAETRTDQILDTLSSLIDP